MKKILTILFMVFAFVSITKADDFAYDAYHAYKSGNLSYPMILILFYMISVVIFLVITRKLAETKEMGVDQAYLLVLFFGILGFLIVLCSKDKGEKQKTETVITPEKELAILNKMFQKRVISKSLYEKRRNEILEKQKKNDKRLQTLEPLRLNGLITEEEYNKKRGEVEKNTVNGETMLAHEQPAISEEKINDATAIENKLKKLKEMKEKGIITEEEFIESRNDIIGKI